MLKKQISRLVNRYGLWRLMHALLIAVITIQTCIFVLELAVPFRPGDSFGAPSNTNVIAAKDLSEVLAPRKESSRELAKAFRSDLFKAASPLQDKPMADKTIERIRSQLKLQCIMEINGKQAAYVNIDGVGLKKCGVGDTVGDLFTVLNINKDSIEVTIVGHKVTLNL